jgi:hypothetical protein
MAPLPAIQSSTLRAINAAREAGAINWDSIGISMSELGSECDRALWLSHRWASAAEQLTAPKLRRFETGNIEEDRLIADLRRVPNVEVLDRDPDRLDRGGNPQQFKVYSHGGHVRGKLDALACGLPEAPKTWHVVECKSHNDDSFKALQKKGVKESKPAHWLQCQKYMQLMNLTRCLYLAVNKNNDEIYCERIEFDAVAVMQLDARLDRVISTPEAPSRIKDKPTDYPCLLCRHKDVCHGETFGRNHCRTCLHATPIVDAGTSAKWVCEKFGKELSVDDQRAGCHAQPRSRLRAWRRPRLRTITVGTMPTRTISLIGVT